GKLERCWKTIGKLAQDRPARLERPPKIAGQCAPDPVNVLNWQRLVQADFVANLLDLLSRRLVVELPLGDQAGWVAGRQSAQPKSQQRDPQPDRHDQEQPAEDILGHALLPRCGANRYAVPALVGSRRMRHKSLHGVFHRINAEDTRDRDDYMLLVDNDV